MNALWLCSGLVAVGLLPIFPIFLSRLRKSHDPRVQMFTRAAGFALLWLCFTLTASGLLFAFLTVFKSTGHTLLWPSVLAFAAIGAYLSYRVVRR